MSELERRFHTKAEADVYARQLTDAIREGVSNTNPSGTPAVVAVARMVVAQQPGGVKETRPNNLLRELAARY